MAASERVRLFLGSPYSVDNKEMKMLVNAIVDEMGRMEERINRRFDEVDRRFEQVNQRPDSLHHEVNACKLSIDAIIMRLDQHEKKLVLL